MPIPSKKENEKPNEFMSRCMSDDKLKEEYPSNKQRTAVCLSKATESLDYMEAADFNFSYESHGFEEEINEDNTVIPEENDYIDVNEEVEEWDVGGYKYKDPKTGEVYEYERKGIYKKGGRTLIPVRASEYQGRKVKINKPFRTPDGPKKFSVYVKNEKGNVVKVNFGDPNMEIKKDNPARRKSFRARHKCETPGPKWKARYWSCKNW
tara:strand:- start:177 stop:800 length:624 start_codon:yes stop_codon:yes gene_type:complete